MFRFKKYSFLSLTSISIFTCFSIFNASLYAEQNKNRGVPIQEDNEFLNRVKEEIGFKQEIIISIGPYYKAQKISLTNGAVLVIDNKDFKAPSFLFYDGVTRIYYILIDYLFYKKFTLEERKFVIAHEVGHALNPNLRGNMIAEQKADELALRYVSIETIVNFLVKYSEPDEEDLKKQRIESLRKVKQG